MPSLETKPTMEMDEPSIEEASKGGFKKLNEIYKKLAPYDGKNPIETLELREGQLESMEGENKEGALYETLKNLKEKIMEEIANIDNDIKRMETGWTIYGLPSGYEKNKGQKMDKINADEMKKFSEKFGPSDYPPYWDFSDPKKIIDSTAMRFICKYHSFKTPKYIHEDMGKLAGRWYHQNEIQTFQSQEDLMKETIKVAQNKKNDLEEQLKNIEGKLEKIVE